MTFSFGMRTQQDAHFKQGRNPFDNPFAWGWLFYVAWNCRIHCLAKRKVKLILRVKQWLASITCRGCGTSQRAAGAESSQRGYLVGGNEIYLAPYDNAKSQSLTNLQLLKNLLPPSPRNDAIFDRLSKIISENVDEMDRIVSLKADLDHNQATGVFRSNRSKALMDEANLFLSSIIRQADERLETSSNDQRRNATLLRVATIIGGLVIVLVVAGAIVTVFRYAREVTQARNELNELNRTLEDRVSGRTLNLRRHVIEPSCL